LDLDLDLDSDSDSDETSVVTFACCFVMARYNLLFVVVLDALQMHISKADNRGHSTRSDRMALRIERIVIIFFKNVLRSTHSLTKTKKIDIRKLRADAVAAAFDAEAEAAGIHLDQSAATASSSSSPSDQHADGYFDWSVAIDASRDVFEKGKEATVYLRTCSSEREREREIWQQRAHHASIVLLFWCSFCCRRCLWLKPKPTAAACLCCSDSLISPICTTNSSLAIPRQTCLAFQDVIFFDHTTTTLKSADAES
jgi:hypothetical protein